MKGYALRVTNWRNLARPILLSVPLSLEIRMLLSSGIGRALLTRGFYDQLQGSRGRSESPPYTCCLSSSFSLKFSVCQIAIFWGSMFWTSSFVHLWFQNILSSIYQNIIILWSLYREHCYSTIPKLHHTVSFMCSNHSLPNWGQKRAENTVD